MQRVSISWRMISSGGPPRTRTMGRIITLRPSGAQNAGAFRLERAKPHSDVTSWGIPSEQKIVRACAPPLGYCHKPEGVKVLNGEILQQQEKICRGLGQILTRWITTELADMQSNSVARCVTLPTFDGQNGCSVKGRQAGAAHLPRRQRHQC